MPQKAKYKTGADVRRACRGGEWTGQTSGLAPGYTQANLAILPQDLAGEFHEFCRKNPRPCPLLEATSPGSAVPVEFAPAADLRTDLPRYRLWKNGELVDEPTDITGLWREDAGVGFVAFLLGCSFTFEAALLAAGLPVRHVELGLNVPMYRTSIECEPAGLFRGPMVVSMRPFTPENARRAAEITAGYPAVHGAPIQIGEPETLGISDLARPDFGDPVPLRNGEIPVFWACGVTPQSVAMAAKPPLMITHAPGCMFVTDRLDRELRVEG